MNNPTFLNISVNRLQGLKARYSIIPIPYEGTVSYGKGTSKGPKAILDASLQLEDFDNELDMETCNLIGIHTGASVELGSRVGEEAITCIHERIRNLIKGDLIPIILGGEHSISFGVVKAMIERYPELHVIHVDAHADLRDSYDDNPYSHACVMRRIYDLGVPIHSVGIRALCHEEASLIRKEKINVMFEHMRCKDTNWIENLLDKIPPKAPVYFTIDVDGLSPAIMPHTGTPVPGGLDWNEILALSRAVTQKFQLVGFDIVELAPNEHSKASDFLCAQLIYKIISYNEAFNR
jgi:agmatinase